MISLNLSKNIFAKKYYPLLLDYSRRWEVYMGSAGSGKSYFITQKLLVRAFSEKIKILVCRRTGATLRNTCFSLFVDLLKKWKVYQYCKVRQTDMNIQLPNGSEIIFLGLDEETKLLSLNNVGTIFIEEAFEVPRAIVEQLNLRMRGTNPNQQILLSFNPISQDSWLYDFCEINPPSSFLYIHSTYKDNPFLSEAYIATLEEMITRNPQKARIFVYGEWGVDAEGLVYQNWNVEEFDKDELARTCEHRVGIDFGYIDPSVIVASLYDEKNHTIYVYDEWYQKGAQLDEMAQAVKEHNLGKAILWCDSAEPRSIDFLRRNGYAAKPCIKGADSVKARIAFLQNNRIIIHPSCKEVIREISNYSYIKKNEKYTENTTHEYSHTLDALGYAYSNIYKANKLQTISKAAIGL